MKPDPVLLGQLYVLRAQLEVLIRHVEGGPESDAEPDAGDDETGCPHPEDRRIDTTTAGGPRRFMCLACDTEVVGLA